MLLMRAPHLFQKGSNCDGGIDDSSAPNTHRRSSPADERGESAGDDDGDETGDLQDCHVSCPRIGSVWLSSAHTTSTSASVANFAGSVGENGFKIAFALEHEVAIFRGDDTGVNLEGDAATAAALALILAMVAATAAAAADVADTPDGDDFGMRDEMAEGKLATVFSEIGFLGRADAGEGAGDGAVGVESVDPNVSFLKAERDPLGGETREADKGEEGPVLDENSVETLTLLKGLGSTDSRA